MNSAVALQPSFVPPAALAPMAVAPRYAVGFCLFLLVNAALFVRPAEIVPALEDQSVVIQGWGDLFTRPGEVVPAAVGWLVGWHIYELLILACFVASFPVLLEQFTVKSLETRPVTACVLGLMLAVALSELAHLHFDRVVDPDGSVVDFGKMVLYYTLFVGLVNSSARLRVFLFCLLVFATATITLAVLQFHGTITLPNLDQTIDGAKDSLTGAQVNFVRLCGSGIFHDPNELGVLIAPSVVLALYWLFDRRSGPARLLWLAPLVLFFYAMSLTQSRGALLALLAGLGVFLVARYGWRMALLFGLFAVPALFLLGSRQADLSTGGGTAQQRILIWSDALTTMRQSPLFGVGRGAFAEQEGLVAHNSYLQCFVELGAFGGMLFLGAFYLTGERLLRLGDRRKYAFIDPEMGRLYPYVFGILTCWVAGMCSLTLCYILPTYTMLALATVFVGTVRTEPPLPAMRFDLRLLGRLSLVAFAGLAGLYLFVRFFMAH
jgi:hypothetical protein